MHRKLVRLLVAVAFLGGIAAPSALASHGHGGPSGVPPEVGDNVKALCRVVGQVQLDNGLSLTPTHNHYRFAGVNIGCDDPLQGDVVVPGNGYLASSFDVSAPPAGAAEGNPTDGPDQADPDNPGATKHGETCAAGWSESAGGLNVADQNSALETDNAEVHFVRSGNLVTAWGPLEWNNQKTDRFIVELELSANEFGGVDEPNPALAAVASAEACTNQGPEITGAELTGKAVVYN